MGEMLWKTYYTMVGKETPYFDSNGETIWLRLRRDGFQQSGRFGVVCVPAFNVGQCVTEVPPLYSEWGIFQRRTKAGMA